MSIELSGNCHLTAGLLCDNKPIGILCGDTETGFELWTGEDFQRIAEKIEGASRAAYDALKSVDWMQIALFNVVSGYVR